MSGMGPKGAINARRSSSGRLDFRRATKPYSSPTPESSSNCRGRRGST